MRTVERTAVDLYNTYVAKLTAQEKDLDKLKTEIEALKVKETAQQKELDDYLTNLDAE